MKKLVNIHNKTKEITEELSPFNNTNIILNDSDLNNFFKNHNIDYQYKNINLFRNAFVHKSYCCMKNTSFTTSNISCPEDCLPLQDMPYERLEFLGDAVIENIIVSYLYRRYPDQREGFLSSMKMNLVNRITLGHLAKVIGLNDYLVIGRTLDDLQNAREEDKILCDVFEAFIAAIYLDFNNDKHGFLSSFMSGAGYQVSELFLINLIEDEASQLDITTFILDDRNYKNKIVKLIKRIHKYNPIFKVSKSDVSRTGEQIITVQLINPNTKDVICEGKGQNNKKAEQDASKNGLIKLGYFKN